MTLSSRVVKAEDQQIGRQRIALAAPRFEPSVAHEVSHELDDAVSEVMNRARQEAVAILEEAHQEVSELRQKAHEEGYREGFAGGQSEGLAEARAAWEVLKGELDEPLALLNTLSTYMERLGEETTLAMGAALSMALFSRLKHERIDVIADYLRELAVSVDKSKVEVFLDPSWTARLSVLEDALQANVPQIVVAIDESLGTGEMRAEGELSGALGGPLTSLRSLVREVTYVDVSPH